MPFVSRGLSWQFLAETGCIEGQIAAVVNSGGLGQANEGRDSDADSLVG